VQESESSKAHIVDSAVPLPPPPLSATATTECQLGRQAPRRPHILVVDDNTICQKVLCRTLKAIDCTTAVANNGQVACDMVKADGANFDLVFLDLRMPVMR
jgi:PleD family two-component response regulator